MRQFCGNRLPFVYLLFVTQECFRRSSFLYFDRVYYDLTSAIFQTLKLVN